MRANTGNWYEKPPVIIQNVGDALQSGALFILGYVTMDNAESSRWLPVCALIMGATGIIIQKLFKEE